MTNQAPDSALVEQEMETIIFYLTAFAFIDGEFDHSERKYIREFISRLVAYRVRLAMKDAEPAAREPVTARWTKHFQEMFEDTEWMVQGLFTESVAEGEDSKEFVYSKLKLRCYELFRKFSPDNQKKLIMLADELANADGHLHPNEKRFRDELAELLAASGPEPDEEAPEVDLSEAGSVVIDEPQTLLPRQENYEFFLAFERHYPTDKTLFARATEADVKVMQRTMAGWAEQRQRGAGVLAGKQSVEELAGVGSVLDEHVYVLQPEPGKDYELLVLGDLHGCYSCLKAALMQADFFAKVDAHHLDPEHNPAMKLVLLGDYIDRGRYSYQGILRTVMQLYLTVPEHVYILRGNHEYYIEFKGRIFAGVRPAEAMDALVGIADQPLFAAYRDLFDQMPCSLLFGQTLFAHAGIPREDTLAEKWKDLSSLNDPDVRFQMLWSDPSEADVIPLDMQKANARFPFGRNQFKSFMSRLGCTTMVRGHERVVEGFKQVYTDPDAMLFSLFSAGGANNNDLPPESNYREVTPMALTMRYRDGATQLTPFVIDYARYNDPDRNAFHAPPPVLTP